MARCRSCGARITWLETEAGKRIPVDEDPVVDGNVVVLKGTKCRILRKGERAEAPRYVAHWATCPDASHWRASGDVVRREASTRFASGRVATTPEGDHGQP